MGIWRLGRLAIFLLIVLGLISVFSALAAANVVPASGKLDVTITLTAEQLKPQDCNGMTLNSYTLAPGGTFKDGGQLSTLILGVPGYDNLSGKSGNDCIVGGAGGDILGGGSGGDVCFGNAYTTFNKCDVFFRGLRQ